MGSGSTRWPIGIEPSPLLTEMPSDSHPLVAFRQSSHAAIIVDVDAPRWTIIDANDAYATATHHVREQLVGHGTFDAFPESAATSRDAGATNVRVSFEQAIATRARVTLPIQRYDIAVEGVPGGFAERYWELSSLPLIGEGGEIIGILHEVENVTERVLGAAERQRLMGELRARNAELEQQELELTLSNQQLQENTVELEAQAETLRATAAQLAVRNEEAEAAQRAAELVATRARRLQALTAAFASAQTIDEVCEVAVTQIVAATGAITGIMVLLDETGETAGIVGNTGLPQSVASRYAEMHVSTDVGPTADALRSGEPVFVEGREGADGLFARYPTLHDRFVEVGAHMVASVPLRIGAHRFGAISFTFGVLPDGQAHRHFLLALAQQASQALERARLLLAEQRARAAAEEANAAKMTFLAMMSHELRTPLNALGGFLELLLLELRGPITPTQRGDLERMRRSHSHLLNLINDVLNYAQIDTGHAQYDIRPVGVGGVLRRIEELVSVQCQAKAILCELRIPDPQPVVMADEERLGQILLNLLSNAIKYTPRGGGLTVWTEQGDGEVCTRVRDTGIGVPADKLAAIFNPFMQVGRRLNTPGEGVGLGLAISRDLAIGMGGS